MIKVSAIICTYERYDLLPKAIDSVINQSLSDKNYELIVVDNTPKEKRKIGTKLQNKYNKYENVQYIFEDIPGLSNARNVGYLLAQGKYISYLDDDAIACKDWLKEVVFAFEKHPKAGVVGGTILPIWSLPQPNWLKEQLLGYVSVVDWGGELRVAQDDEWFAGANISFLKDLLIEKGGFSTSLGRVGNSNSLMSNEENELIEFTKKKGYQLVFNPLAKVDHLVEPIRLTQHWFRKRVAWQAVSDFTLNGAVNNADIDAKISSVKEYLSSLPPLQRNIQGLNCQVDDYGTFRWQLSAIYNYTYSILCGFQSDEVEIEC